MESLKWRYLTRGDDFQGWETYRVLTNGSVACFGANEWVAGDGVTTNWNLEIEVYRKRRRRDVNSLHLTGPGGLEAPGFFLEALSNFEIVKARPGDRIQITGADGRRYRAYHKILGKRGYYPTRFQGYPYLIKIIA